MEYFDQFILLYPLILILLEIHLLVHKKEHV